MLVLDVVTSHALQQLPLCAKGLQVNVVVVVSSKIDDFDGCHVLLLFHKEHQHRDPLCSA